MDNLGIIMNQTLADREKELNMITNQYTKSDKEKAQKWLNTKTEENDTPKIKIDRTSNVHINHENIGVRKRRVRFDIEEKSQSIGLEGFLSKLKKKPSKKTLEEKFDLIIENQNKILALLQKNVAAGHLFIENLNPVGDKKFLFSMGVPVLSLGGFLFASAISSCRSPYIIFRQKKDPSEEESFEKYKRLAYMRFLTETRL